MKPRRDLLECENILLDTSVLIDYWNADKHLSSSTDEYKNDTTVTRMLFTRKLLDYLVDTPLQSNREKRFFISSVTIGELTRIKSSTKLSRDIIRALNTSNVEFLPFNNKVAIYMNGRFDELLTRKAKTELARLCKLYPDDLTTARE